MESRIISSPKMPYAFGAFRLNPFVYSCSSVKGAMLTWGDGDVPFFGVSFSLISPGTGYEKSSIFLEPVEKCN